MIISFCFYVLLRIIILRTLENNKVLRKKDNHWMKNEKGPIFTVETEYRRKRKYLVHNFHERGKDSTFLQSQTFLKQNRFANEPTIL